MLLICKRRAHTFSSRCQYSCPWLCQSISLNCAKVNLDKVRADVMTSVIISRVASTHTQTHTQVEQKFCHPWANNRTSVQQQFVLNAKMDKASARRASPAGRQQDAKSNPLIIYETAKSKRQVANGKWQVADCGTEGAA